MSFAGIFPNKFELDKDYVILDILEVKIFLTLFIFKVIFSKLALNQNFVFFICITENLVNMLDVSNWNKFWNSFPFFKFLMFLFIGIFTT